MKGIFIYLMATGIAIMFVSCGGSRRAVSTPCMKEGYDTPEEFAATGMADGNSHFKDMIHIQALRNAQGVLRMKINRNYNAIIKTRYSDSIDNNIETKMLMASVKIFDAMFPSVRECCGPYFATDANGMATCFVAVKMSKSELADNIATQVDEVLTDEEKLGINFNRKQFKEKLYEEFKNYKEEN